MEEKGETLIFNYISDNVTSVQFVDTFGGVNYKVSIYGCWIYDSNNKRALPLIKESQYNICYYSDGDDMYADFEMVYNAFRYVNPK